MNLQISYPFKPYIITQAWGNENPAYAAQFNMPDFKRHNGIDAFTGKYDIFGKVVSEFPVYCPVEGFKVESVSFEPTGGGNQISLISKQPVVMFEQTCYARIWLCHAKKILVPIGYEPALGELLMIADNTGFSTGVHTHMGLYRLTEHYELIDHNEATGSFDPMLFFTKKYAVDKASAGTLVTSGLRYMAYLLGK